jgi:hypothetical protein
MELTESELDVLLELIEDWDTTYSKGPAPENEEDMRLLSDKLFEMRERQRDINFTKNGHWSE